MIQQYHFRHLSKGLSKINSRAIYIPMFIAALFTNVREWKQPKCPWTSDWIRKL